MLWKTLFHIFTIITIGFQINSACWLKKKSVEGWMALGGGESSIFWRFSILVCMYMCMNMPNPQKAQSPITPDENPKCVNPIYNSDPCRAVNPFLA